MVSVVLFGDLIWYSVKLGELSHTSFIGTQNKSCPQPLRTLFTTSSKATATHAEAIRANFDYEHRHYTDAMARAYVHQNCSDVAKAFDCIKPGAFKADIFRVCALYHEGGIYVDDDRLPVRRLESVIPCAELVVGTGSAYLHPLLPIVDRPRVEMIFAAASIRHHPFLRCALDRIAAHADTQYYGHVSTDITGPSMLADCYKSNPERVTIAWGATRSKKHDIALLPGGTTSGLIFQGSNGPKDDAHYSNIYHSKDVYLC